MAIANSGTLKTGIHTRRHQLRERLVVLAVLFMTLVSAAAALLLVTSSDISLPVLNRSIEQMHYSQPVTVLTQSAPDSDGRNAYVKMTFIVSAANKKEMRSFSEQETTTKAVISQVLNQHDPASLLDPEHLSHLQESLAETLSATLNIDISYVYFDRMTVQ